LVAQHNGSAAIRPAGAGIDEDDGSDRAEPEFSVEAQVVAWPRS
jgi:hypothetical protein